MAQTVENAEAVVVTAPKEKIVTPVTVKDVENIAKKFALGPGFVAERNPKIENAEDDDNFVWLYFKHRVDFTRDIRIYNKTKNAYIVIKAIPVEWASPAEGIYITFFVIGCSAHLYGLHDTSVYKLDSADFNDGEEFDSIKLSNEEGDKKFYDEGDELVVCYYKAIGDLSFTL